MRKSGLEHYTMVRGTTYGIYVGSPLRTFQVTETQHVTGWILECIRLWLTTQLKFEGMTKQANEMNRVCCLLSTTWTP
jgi:hypothetical protein